MGRKVKSYLFDVGNSGNGPLGMCIRVRARTKRGATQIANGLLSELGEISVSSGRLTDGVEYCTIYLNDALKPRHIFAGDTREVEKKKRMTMQARAHNEVSGRKAASPLTEAIPTSGLVTHHVHSSRLAWGVWDHEKGCSVGEGDIHSSYSGETIATKGTIRKPFEWQGSLWVAVSTSESSGVRQAEAYRLLPEQLMEGAPVTYSAKSGIPEGAKAARADPRGFYHGMTVKYGRNTFVLCGPKTTFLGDASTASPDRIPAPCQAQLDLF